MLRPERKEVISWIGKAESEARVSRNKIREIYV